MVVAAVFTGILPYGELVKRLATESAEPLTMALNHVAPNNSWATLIVALGSVIAHTAVLLVFQLGQPRIFMSMARDGLLPKKIAAIHPRYQTPHVATILTGLFVGLFAGIANLDEMVDLTNIGTLFAFFLVCIGIPILRFKDPQRPRLFRVPFGPWVLPILGAGSCLFLMIYLPPSSWWRFAGWLTLGLSVYFAYAFSHSLLRANSPKIVTSRPLKRAASGFLMITMALFMVPHNAGPIELLQNLQAGSGALQLRVLAAMILIAAGTLLTCFGLKRGLNDQ
jgi:APA family basic amino acid/polyamine antiporter